MTIELGIIEGYYGHPWSWQDRRDQVAALAPHGYGFYMYAPKADPYLRRAWQQEHPAEMGAELIALADVCADHGVRFGVGLSPFELYRDFNADAQAALARKLAFFEVLGVQDLGILFDDMRGDLPDLAATQVEILHWIAQRTTATRIVACPTYYSDDPGLDRAFGARPADYLEDFGRLLDPAIEVFWTGEEVCSREYTPGHLARVTRQLGRKPFLWDNYPVNDGPRMSPHLHLRAMTGRPASLAPHLAAHAVNPALQPILSRIPAISLAQSYREGDAYQYGQAFLAAANEVLGPELARRVQGHLTLLHDTGRDRLGEALPALRARYAAFDHPGAREIVAFLDGAYVMTAEMMAEEP
ncbi:beta-N-acetylglucosaminidase domain-containing protein [Phenylobacterium sp.]|uniref:beta-N-acetylglucosaminidase domain-containing protein n=1 Tax=Phenylobacterium sp. TaxID=1871053 RepID=UPI00271CD846|nr:beta-N-acetylglucosaminidase domain-containing protein [Phenylobacterium sp.]MDO8801454.1 beta-N-acetylglucosaminidase domain-containing protein [Phenylobacterium sp.]